MTHYYPAITRTRQLANAANRVPYAVVVASRDPQRPVTDSTAIYCVGDFVASGSSIANTSQIPSNLQVFCTGGKVDISGGSDFYGAVYAPASKVVRSSGSNNVYGSLIGKELTLSGGGGAHADTAISGLDGTSGKVSLVE